MFPPKTLDYKKTFKTYRPWKIYKDMVDEKFKKRHEKPVPPKRNKQNKIK